MVKYVLVTGGVISGVGKGIIASSIGLLIKATGLRVSAIKIDPYLNIDAGTISPLDHGECFVLDDGGETDLDLGNYERYLGISLSAKNNITTGKIYNQVIQKERRGDYLGKTVQVVPHITDTIQQWILDVAKISVDDSGLSPDVCVIELGGTVGDIESSPFIEALRQFQFRIGLENLFIIHVSLVPTVGAGDGEQKTKPTQASVRDLRGLGLAPDAICCRSLVDLDPGVKQKISMFCQVPPANVIGVHDCPSLYHVPLLLEREGLLATIQKKLNLPNPQPEMPLLKPWSRLADTSVDAKLPHVVICVVGKYTQVRDSYISISKALSHATVSVSLFLDLLWVEASDLEPDAEESAREASWAMLRSADGIVVPGGFGSRGTDGKILACTYARTNKIPFLGICFGLQLATIEFARNVLGLEDAHTTEIAPETKNPVVINMPEVSTTHLGGTMRLGSRATRLRQGSRAKEFYGDAEVVWERHRHRYEVNPAYVDRLEAAGMQYVGRDENNERMEILELSGHPYYFASQFHPEFKSRPLEPSPLFVGLVMAASARTK